MWPDESGNWSVYGSDGAVSVPASPDPISDTGGWSSPFTTAVDFAKNVLGTVASVDQYLFNRQVGQLQLQGAKTNLNTQSYISGINGQVAMKQADAQLAVAQGRLNSIKAAYADPNSIGMMSSNIQRQLAGLGSGNSLMLWLAVAGVAIAYMQFKK